MNIGDEFTTAMLWRNASGEYLVNHAVEWREGVGIELSNLLCCIIRLKSKKGIVDRGVWMMSKNIRPGVWNLEGSAKKVSSDLKGSALHRGVEPLSRGGEIVEELSYGSGGVCRMSVEKDCPTLGIKQGLEVGKEIGQGVEIHETWRNKLCECTVNPFEIETGRYDQLWKAIIPVFGPTFIVSPGSFAGRGGGGTTT